MKRISAYLFIFLFSLNTQINAADAGIDPEVIIVEETEFTFSPDSGIGETVLDLSPEGRRLARINRRKEVDKLRKKNFFFRLPRTDHSEEKLKRREEFEKILGKECVDEASKAYNLKKEELIKEAARVMELNDSEEKKRFLKLLDASKLSPVAQADIEMFLGD